MGDPALTTPAPTLELWHGDQRVVLSPGATFVIGRDRASGLAIDDPLISNRHLVIWFDRVWRVRGEGRNGTFLRGQRIEELVITDRVTLTLAGPNGPALVLVPGSAA